MPKLADRTIDGLKVYECDAGECAGQFVVADGAGWIPGVWATRTEAITGARLYIKSLSTAAPKRQQ